MDDKRIEQRNIYGAHHFLEGRPSGRSEEAACVGAYAEARVEVWYSMRAKAKHFSCVLAVCEYPEGSFLKGKHTPERLDEATSLHSLKVGGDGVARYQS